MCVVDGGVGSVVVCCSLLHIVAFFCCSYASFDAFFLLPSVT